MQAHPARRDSSDRASASCGFCDCRLGKPAVACPGCGVRYHEVCWRFVLGCPGCGHPAAEARAPDELGPYGASEVADRERWCSRAYTALTATMAAAATPIVLVIAQELAVRGGWLPPLSKVTPYPGGIWGILEAAWVLASFLCWPLGVWYGLAWVRYRRARGRSPVRARLSAANP